MTGAVCRGSWSLGSACGKCDRCRNSMGQAAETIRSLRLHIENNKPKAMTHNEAEAAYNANKLWEQEAAKDGRYKDAAQFQMRANEIVTLYALSTEEPKHGN